MGWPRSIGTCPDCGKQRYTSRATAKQAARAHHPDSHMSVYQCGRWWHYGKLPSVIARGITDRSGMQAYPPSTTRNQDRGRR